MDVAGINDSDSESCSSLDQSATKQHQNLAASTGSPHHEEDGLGAAEEETGEDNIEDQEDDEDEDEDDDAIPFSDIESLSSTERADVIPHQRLTINNTAALLRALKSIALPLSDMPFVEHQALTAPKVIPIPDINDDLTRELAFYKQCLDAATRGRALLVKEGVPFSRPADFFAEMVKTDEHMGKIRQKMTDEEAGKRAAAEARKQRDLKRFGKQVQVAKLQERDKAKRDTLDKINLLKRSTSFHPPFSYLHPHLFKTLFSQQPPFLPSNPPRPPQDKPQTSFEPSLPFLQDHLTNPLSLSFSENPQNAATPTPPPPPRTKTNFSTSPSITPRTITENPPASTPTPIPNPEAEAEAEAKAKTTAAPNAKRKTASSATEVRNGLPKAATRSPVEM